MVVDNNLIPNTFIDRGPWDGQNKPGLFFPYIVDNFCLTPNLHFGLLWDVFLGTMDADIL